MQPDVDPQRIDRHGIDHLATEHQPVEDQRANLFQPLTHAGSELIDELIGDEQVCVHIAPAVGDAFAKAASQPGRTDTGVGFAFGGEGIDEIDLHRLGSPQAEIRARSNSMVCHEREQRRRMSIWSGDDVGR
ncbi:MAG: hypothetical protein HC802_14120 [Caldilineaceae bacterium]|nr:hypothetical protein [Caldilineaceae bacterium]